jgi:release factor glutamine methyltransferase
LEIYAYFMTIKEILRNTSLNHEISPLERGILLSLALNRPKEYTLAHSEKKLTRLQEKKFIDFARRRSAGEPIAYITGKKEFFGLDFIVNKNVLIPRPETELLVENAIKKINLFFCHPALDAGSRESAIPPDTRFRGDDNLDIIDIGTGSGNIIISIAKNIPSKIRNKTNFYAIDISKESLRIVKKNAKRHKLDKKIKFIQSDMLEFFRPSAKKNKKINNILIVANLPYVSPALYRKNKNNLKYEPKAALLSRNNGLAHYIKLFKQVRLLIADRYSLILEISPEQKPEIGRIIKEYLPKTKIHFFKDLAGKWRMAEIKTSSRPSPLQGEG